MFPFKKGVGFFVVKKAWWTAAACLCAACLMFYIVNYPAAVGASATARQLPIYCVQREQKLVSISFDAAWGDVKERQEKRTPAALRLKPEIYAKDQPRWTRRRTMELRTGSRISWATTMHTVSVIRAGSMPNSPAPYMM